MSDDADKSLEREVVPGPGLRFTLDGKDYELPKPFPMRLWLKLLMAVREDPDADDAKWFSLNVAARAEDVVSWATGLSVDALCAGLGEGWFKLTNDIAAQLGEEMVDSSPFAPARQALATLSRARRFAEGAANKSSNGRGGTPA